MTHLQDCQFTITRPTEGQDILWFNFDVRANAGSSEFQIIGGPDNIAWALFYSNSPTAGLNSGLSGDCDDLTFADCGINFTGWADTPFVVPDFSEPTNYYVMVWDQESTNNYDFSINFKARYGCGNSDIVACNLETGTVSTVCNNNNTYTLTIPISGSNAQYSASDSNALSISSDVCLGNLESGNITGSFTLTYPIGVDYDVDISTVIPSSISNCAEPFNPDDCTINVTGTPDDCCINPINPSPSCNALKVIVVLDESGSIDADTEEDVEDATLALANALIDTGAQMAIVEFSTDSSIGSYGGYTNWSTVDQAFYDALNNNTGGLRSSYGDGGWTNWEAALDDVLDLNDIQVADIVLFMTDGNPTAYIRDSDQQILTNQNAATSLANALDESCEVKQDGSHIFMLGVGGNITASNLEAISGPIVDDGPANPTLTVLSADYGLITSGDLTQCFLDIAQSGCNNDLSLEKTVYAGHDGGVSCNGSKTIPNPTNSQVTYCFTISNNGDQTISNIDFEDLDIGIDETQLTPAFSTSLNSGQSVTYYYQTTFSGGQTFPFNNTANITGETPTGDPLSDSSSAEVTEPECTPPSLTTEDGSVCAESQSSIDLSTLVTSSGTVTFHTNQTDADNGDNALTDTNVSPLAQTTYVVRSEVADDCYVTDTITISIDPLPNAQASGGELTCTVLSLQLSGSSTTNGVTYSWTGPNSFTSDDQNPTVSETGTYTLTVTVTATGCTSTATAEVTEDVTAPTANAGADMELTCTTLEVTLDGSGSSTNPDADLSYAWSGPNGYSANTEDITVSAIGTYTLTVTDNDNGCFATDSAEVTADEDTPTANAGADMELTCTTLEVTLDGSGSSTNPDADLSYSWSGPNGYSANTEDITVSAIGTYTLTVTDNDNGCFVTDSAEVTEDKTAPTANAGADMELTCTTLEVTLDGSGSSTNPDADLSYAWSGPNGYSANTEDITVSAIGTYTLTVTDNDNGCFATDSAEVTADEDTPTANAGADMELTCTTLEVTLDGSGSSTNPDADLSYSWSGPNGYSANTEDITVSAIGTYTLTVTDNDNGCFVTDSAEVTEDKTAPTANAGADMELTCTTLEVTLDGSGSSTNPDADLSYAWSGPNGYSANTEDITVSAIGTYTLTVTDNDNGCFATDSAEVTVDEDTPTANAGADMELTCTTLEVTLDGSGSSTNPDADLSYAWSGPNGYSANTEDITVSAIGTYTLTVTDNDNGCFATDSAEVTEDKTAPTANAGADMELTCTTLEVTLDGSGSSTNPDADLSYAWSGPNGYSANTEDITVSAIGTYTLTVTDNDNGCFATDSAEVTADEDTPTANAGADMELTCTTLEVTLDGSGSSTNPDADLSYAWSGPNGYSANTEDITVSAIGTYTLTVTDNDNGCFATDSAEVTADEDTPTANAGADMELTCTTLEVTLDGSGSSTNPDADLSYAWSGPNGYSANTEDITVSEIGTYTLTVTDNDNGCFATDSAEVTEDVTVPTANAGADMELTCTTLEVTLDGSGSSTNPDADLSYAWSGPNGYSANTEDITVSAIGTYTLTVTDNDNGCFATDSAEVTADEDTPTANAGADMELTCTTLEVTLDGSGSSTNPDADLSYAWSGPNGYSANTEDITVSAIGTYTLTVTDNDNGCFATDSAEVISDTTLPQVSIEPVEPLCVDANPIQLVGSPEGGTWGGDVDANGIFNPANGSGTVTYTYVDVNGNGCENTASIDIIVNPLPEVSIEEVDSLCIDADVIQLVGSPEGGTWSGDVTSSGEFDPSGGSGSATYTFTDDNGCTNSETINIQVNVLPIIIASNPVCGEQSEFGTYSVEVTVDGGIVTSDYTTVDQGNNVWLISDIPNNTNITVSVTNQNGCENTVDIVAPECICIELEVSYTDVTCFGLDDGTITVEFVSDGATVTVNGEPYNPDMEYEPGIYTVVAYYEGNDNEACILSEIITIEEPVAVDISASSTNVTCYGEGDGTITIESLSEGAVYTIKKDGYGADLSGQAFFGPGTYVIQATLEDNTSSRLSNSKSAGRFVNPCEKTVVVVITEPAAFGCKLFF